jgi:hypothetical protein
MRKLQEIKDNYAAGSEDQIIEEELEDLQAYHQNQNAVYSGGIELRSVNDFSRLFINEEDEDDDS